MEHGIFLDATYSYRQWPYAVIAVGVGSLDLFVLILNAHHFTNGRYLADNWFSVVAGSLWLLTTLFIAAWCGWRFTLAPLVQTRIDMTGITIDQLEVPWTAIASLYARSNGRHRVSLFYTTRGNGPFRRQRMLPIEPLLPADCEELLEKIAAYVEKRYPDVTIG